MMGFRYYRLLGPSILRPSKAAGYREHPVAEDGRREPEHAR